MQGSLFCAIGICAIFHILYLCTMKKIWKILLIVVAVVSILAVTCPSKQRHSDAIVKFMSKELHKQADNLVKEYEKQHNGSSIPDKGLKALSKLEETLKDQMKPAIEMVLVVKNFGLFSIGCFENETEGVTWATIGVLGMILPNKSLLSTDYNLKLNRTENDAPRRSLLSVSVKTRAIGD